MLLHPIWNPNEGIDLGFFEIKFYSMMFVLAFGLGLFIMTKIYKKEGLSEKQLDSLFVYSIVSILLGARLGHVIFYQSELFKEDFFSVFLPFSFKDGIKFTGFAGLASHGAAIVMIIGMYIYSKKVIFKNPLWILDRVVLPVSLGAFFVRIGNFLNSEIVGEETTSQFGIKFLRHSIDKYEAMRLTGIQNVNEAYTELLVNPKFKNEISRISALHPSQLYEAIAYVFVFAFLMFLYWKTKNSKKQGYIFGFFMVLLWGVRFFVEFVKASQGGFEKYPMFNVLTTGQWLSIPMILVGVYLIITSNKRLVE
jgi:prolipoprotein diacylglyceryl transferase